MPGKKIEFSNAGGRVCFLQLVDYDILVSYLKLPAAFTSDDS